MGEKYAEMEKGMRKWKGGGGMWVRINLLLSSFFDYIIMQLLSHAIYVHNVGIVLRMESGQVYYTSDNC